MTRPAHELAYRQLPVVRVWTRDGSTNHMTLAAATANIVHQMILSRHDAEDLLLRGATVKTPLAAFRLAGRREC